MDSLCHFVSWKPGSCILKTALNRLPPSADRVNKYVLFKNSKPCKGCYNQQFCASDPGSCTPATKTDSEVTVAKKDDAPDPEEEDPALIQKVIEWDFHKFIEE